MISILGFFQFFHSLEHMLSNVNKFNHLTSLLESSAAKTIAGLTLTDANYDETVATLNKQFGNDCEPSWRHYCMPLYPLITISRGFSSYTILWGPICERALSAGLISAHREGTQENWQELHLPEETPS